MVLKHSWTVTIGYMVLISILSHIPQDDIPESISPGPDGIDYLFHFVEYSILGFLLFRSLASDELLFGNEVQVSLLIGISFAILDEFHQSFVPGRHMSPVDMISDSIGVLFGTFICFRLALDSS